MDQILIVAGTEKGKTVLTELLTMESTGEITAAGSGNEARRLFMERDYDLCVINTPLKDEFGTELALHIAGRGTAQVMLLIKNELADEISAKVEESGVFVVPKPVNRSFFWSALKLVNAAHNRMLSMQMKNERLQNQINDIKTIDRAKCLLIQFCKVTEPEAHRFIEKRAMDLRMTKKEVAEAILKKYNS